MLTLCSHHFHDVTGRTQVIHELNDGYDCLATVEAFSHLCICERENVEGEEGREKVQRGQVMAIYLPEHLQAILLFSPLSLSPESSSASPAHPRGDAGRLLPPVGGGCSRCGCWCHCRTIISALSSSLDDSQNMNHSNKSTPSKEFVTLAIEG